MKKTPKKTTRPKATTAASAKKPARKRSAAIAAVTENVHKFEAAKPAKPRKSASAKGGKASDIENLGELPRSYGGGEIFVVAQEPHWLFCYWDPKLTEGGGNQIFLRHSRKGSAEHEGEARVPSGTNTWYLAVRDADAAYQVELGAYRDGRWETLTRSGTVLTPSDSLAGLDDPVFANMPLHLTFQQLVEKLRGQMREGESLAETLGRLQASGELPVGALSPSQRLAFDALLDSQLGSLTSGDLGRFLSSPGASLFSGGFAPSSSWGGAASWSEAPGGLSSPGGFSSGFLALLGLVGASWSSGAMSSALSSWAAAALSSWSSSSLASWSSAALSSWSSSALSGLSSSSLSGLSSSALSGLSSAGLSSWGQSSWGPGASWSAQPFSRPAERGFFMHVNAEVIFYGGTHPDAKVTVGGREIPLRPDGSFHFHFVFPDGEFEIPVVATSPDGKETRSAVLSFERATAREGDVGSTAQPPLDAPMGKK